MKTTTRAQDERRRLAWHRRKYLGEILKPPVPGMPAPKPTTTQMEIADDLVRLGWLLDETTDPRMRSTLIGQRERLRDELRRTVPRRRRL